MAPKFGTSGLRGLVSELTLDLVADYTRAFLRACPSGNGLWVGRDLRASSPALAATVLQAAREMGVSTVDAGDLPTPALALAAMSVGAAAVMVTGSHIPADRNGLKFYLPDGEISKADEAAILAALGGPLGNFAQDLEAAPVKRDAPGAGRAWSERYVKAFGPTALAGLRLGVWSHSAVSRDLLLETLRELGAEVIELGRSETFIPIDTEAISQKVRQTLIGWVQEYKLDAILSTDGDGDRPLLTDAEGQVVPGDILGQITARIVGADTVVTPINSNTGPERSKHFAKVIRTRIGSPYVIVGMAEAAHQARVVGYEANGGFLLGFSAQGPAGVLPPLPTRDSLLPMLAPLSLAKASGGLAALVAAEPKRFTAADRIEHISIERAQTLLAQVASDPARRAELASKLGEEIAALDQTDGLRLTFKSERIFHMRPSGNAPEFRLYTEAETLSLATDLLMKGLAELRLSLQ